MTKLKMIVASLCLMTAMLVKAAPGDFVETAIQPTRVMWTSDNSGTYVKNANILTEKFSGQVAVNDGHLVEMKSDDNHTASILIDFGKEINAGLKIFTGMSSTKSSVHLRITYGESVTEAMSVIATSKQNPTNDHAVREFTVEVPWLGHAVTGFSGFRFVRIDLLDKGVDFKLRSVQALTRMRDYEYVGSFKCNDELLNQIWQIGAYTTHLCMQEYIWDAPKRDRLVWLGDLNTEILTSNTVFGPQAYPLIQESLDFGSTGYPLPQWMNGMPSYSMWWIINQYDLFLYSGNVDYLRKQRTYLRGLVEQLAQHIDKSGAEKIQGGFLDWPSSTNQEAVHAGMQAMLYLTYDRAAKIANVLGDLVLEERCKDLMTLVSKHRPSSSATQALTLNIVAGFSKNAKKDAQQILKNGLNQYSTFFGGYTCQALTQTGYFQEALDNVRKYWGAMIDLGATSFWEDLEYKNVPNAARIDDFVPEGKFDIHGDGGGYCYVGLRASFAHGWASGPTSWLINTVLGITPLEPGCKTVRVKPQLGDLKWAEGAMPTPYGLIKVSVKQGADKKPVVTVDAPAAIKVIQD